MPAQPFSSESGAISHEHSPQRPAHKPLATPLSPPLKWAGGKRWLVPQLLHLFEPFRDTHRLVEPFCGGLSVSLGCQPDVALLNDINPHLINFYQHAKQGFRPAFAMRNERDGYFAARDTFNHLILQNKANTIEGASLFYYLNRTGFNGLCRFNQKGLYNVPFGRYKTIPYREDFSPYSTVMADWKFTNTDFELLTVDSEDFIYADPPYDSTFTQYSQGGFSWEDQQRLATWLAAQGGPVVASNQATDRIIELYTKLGFTVTTLPAPRRIACNGDRQPALEMLATKNI